MNVPRQTALVTTSLIQQQSTGGIATAACADCVFSWLEKSYPAYLPGGPATQTAAPYSYRSYGNKALLAYSSGDGHLYYQGPLYSNGVADLGLLSSYKAGAGCN
jgi:hypothetical protein